MDSIEENGDNARIVIRNIVNTIVELGMEVIAEGVDTYEQFALLKEAGCSVIQGYYFSKPLTAGEFGKLIERSCHDN